MIVIAKTLALEIEPNYTTERRSKMQQHVEHIITIDPMLRRGLGSKSAEEFVSKRSITETKEQLAVDLFSERYRKKFGFSQLNEETSLESLEDLVRNQIPEDAKEALAVYVAYRNNVICVLREKLKRTESGLATEDKVHQLIYPRYKEGEEIGYSAHNL